MAARVSQISIPAIMMGAAIDSSRLFLSGICLQTRCDMPLIPTASRQSITRRNTMRNVHVDYQGAVPDFKSASQLAKGAAEESRMQQPTIVSWHQNSNQHMSPYYDGANPDSWWEKYGEGNGGKLEVSVGDEFGFVMMDTEGYETLGEMPLRNLTDETGTHYLCFTPILGRLSNKPSPAACTVLDGWLADQL
jgi:hypothetical protein